MTSQRACVCVCVCQCVCQPFNLLNRCTKCGMNVMPLGTNHPHNFQFPVICSKKMADSRTYEVGAKLAPLSSGSWNDCMVSDLGKMLNLNAKCSSVTTGQQFPLQLVHLMKDSWAVICSVQIMGRDECFWCVNFKISTKLHRDGEKWEC
jgi:hypothetical protein